MLSSIQNEIEVTNVGSFALDTLRIEKGIPEFGSEIGRLTKPLDIGGENYTDIDKVRKFIATD